MLIDRVAWRIEPGIVESPRTRWPVADAAKDLRSEKLPVDRIDAMMGQLKRE